MRQRKGQVGTTATLCQKKIMNAVWTVKNHNMPALNETTRTHQTEIGCDVANTEIPWLLLTLPPTFPITRSTAVCFIFLQLVPKVQKMFSHQTWSELCTLRSKLRWKVFDLSLDLCRCVFPAVNLGNFTRLDLLLFIFLIFFSIGAFLLFWKGTLRATENGSFQANPSKLTICVCFAGEDSNEI